MKYSRPVWELMGDCAGELPDRFRFAHVQRWFETRYPDINERTLRVHLTGLTAGGSSANPSLAKKPPLFRRVEHGEYEVIGRASAAPAGPVAPAPVPTGPSVSPRPGLVVLIGHESIQRGTPAPVRELFLASAFTRARAGADDAGASWFVLTSEHGLLDPGAVVSPYARRLSTESAGFRRAWAAWVVAKLDALVDELAATTVHLDAADEVLDILAPALERAGATVRRAAGDPGAGCPEHGAPVPG